MQPGDLFLSSNLQTEEIQRFLEAHGFEHPQAADRHLQRLGDLLEQREVLAGFAPQLLEELSRAVDPDAALTHLVDFLEAAPSASGLFAYLRSHPAALEVLLRILGASPFLTQLLVRNPEYFYWLIEGNHLARVQPSEYFKRQAEGICSPFLDSENALDALRRLRRRESLRIAAQDLLGLSRLEGTVAQISALADAILQQTFEILAPGFLPSGIGFAVLAMGKLGGQELNFSSDIDLIYVYSPEEKRPEALQFAREYTRALSNYSNEGSLYRVDLRLRPKGQGGEIAYSLEGCRQYYETWADTLDRLALLKCRCVAGSKQVGQDFLELVEDFVFKKYLDHAALEEIRWLKRRIDRKVTQSREGRNIKLGEGGIREIEFFVQSFQLLYGGSCPEIRSRSTLGALDRLADYGFLPLDDHRRLRSAYVFLRDLEHKLQLVHDRQTHILPEDDYELGRCARRMGYPAKELETLAAQFHDELARHTTVVNEIFESLFRSDSEGGSLQELILNPELGPEEAVRELESRAVRSAPEVYEGLKLLEQAPSFPHSPSRTRNLLANLVPELIEACQATRSPLPLFSRFDRFCEALGARANLYAELISNPEFAHRLFRIFASGEFLCETLIRNPQLLDSVLLVATNDLGLEQFESVRESQAPFRDQLRLFKRREEFKTALKDLFAEGTSNTRVRLTQLAELCLKLAADNILERVTLPSLPWGLFALGKLGGQELTYHSDLDLMLIYSAAASDSGASLRFQDFLKQLQEELEAYTETGWAYRLDLRLRPEGTLGPLAVPKDFFEDYFEQRAEAWERLAYVKMRPIYSQGDLFDPLMTVFKRSFSEAEMAYLAHIRRRKEIEIGQEDRSDSYNFKVGQGGLMDIQFVTQFLQVQNRVREFNTARALEALEERSAIASGDARVLREGWAFLLRLETMQRLLQEQPVNSIPRRGADNDVLSRFLGYASGDDLVRLYLEHTQCIRQLYLKVFPIEPRKIASPA
ncbi:MAG: hypothetical protein HY645_04860 [Acidobacteria bacterium]|nr:hypothetical protein [Acidobacteriota bacterium]